MNYGIILRAMMIKHLSLTNFRNYSRLEIDLPQGITLFQGDNAQGKSNLLESIYYLATTRSASARSDFEVVNWLVRDDPLGYSRLVADVEWDRSGQRVEVTLSPTPGARCAPVFRKTVRINGVPKRSMDLIGLVHVVLFRPHDIDLVCNAPGDRRRYLDAMLCQLNNHYCRTLQSYNRILAQRNCLLRTLRERGGAEDQLAFWDQRLAEYGGFVTACRAEALRQLDRFAQPLHAEMTGQREQLRLSYQPSIPHEPPDGPEAHVGLLEGAEGNPTAKVLAASFLEGLQRVRREEIARGVTVLGPHRDDFRFLLADADCTIYGSRGQQRTAALAAKLAETEVVRQVKGHWPILLLDDVMSELDGQRRQQLMALVNGATQTLMTTTDVDAYSLTFLSQVNRYRVCEGRLERLGD